VGAGTCCGLGTGQNRPPATLDDLTQEKALLLQRFFFLFDRL